MKNLFFLIPLLIFCFSCSKDDKQLKLNDESNLSQQTTLRTSSTPFVFQGLVIPDGSTIEKVDSKLVKIQLPNTHKFVILNENDSIQFIGDICITCTCNKFDASPMPEGVVGCQPEFKGFDVYCDMFSPCVECITTKIKCPTNSVWSNIEVIAIVNLENNLRLLKNNEQLSEFNTFSHINLDFANQLFSILNINKEIINHTLFDSLYSYTEGNSENLDLFILVHDVLLPIKVDKNWLDHLKVNGSDLRGVEDTGGFACSCYYRLGINESNDLPPDDTCTISFWYGCLNKCQSKSCMIRVRG
ncbi:MAG: hypothetical protein IPM42_17460 [Saprospiraceae bacterium]|nr:hypothetical protein [Saprospiraceae bacterium]